MQSSTATRDRLVGEACSALGDVGLAGLTVLRVARRAGVSAALVFYHFESKDRLLLAAAVRLAPARWRERLAALDQRGGLDSLDALWGGIASTVASGRERAYAELLLHAAVDEQVAAVLAEQRAAEVAAIAARAPSLLLELGAQLTIGADEFATLLAATLDGLGALLLAGSPSAAVRAAYDAFWLTTLAAGQTPRR